MIIPLPTFAEVQRGERQGIPGCRLIMTAVKMLKSHDRYAEHTLEEVYREVVKMAEEEYK